MDRVCVAWGGSGDSRRKWPSIPAAALLDTRRSFLREEVNPEEAACPRPQRDKGSFGGAREAGVEKRETDTHPPSSGTLRSP